MNPIPLLFFKSLIPAHTRRLKTGKVVNVRQYTDKRTKRMEDDKTLDMFADDDTITTPRQEMIAEHKRLVDVLESPSRKDDQVEAKKQKKELGEYEGRDPFFGYFANHNPRSPKRLYAVVDKDGGVYNWTTAGKSVMQRMVDSEQENGRWGGVAVVKVTASDAHKYKASAAMMRKWGDRLKPDDTPQIDAKPAETKAAKQKKELAGYEGKAPDDGSFWSQSGREKMRRESEWYKVTLEDVEEHQNLLEHSPYDNKKSVKGMTLNELESEREMLEKEDFRLYGIYEASQNNKEGKDAIIKKYVAYHDEKRHKRAADVKKELSKRWSQREKEEKRAKRQRIFTSSSGVNSPKPDGTPKIDAKPAEAAKQKEELAGYEGRGESDAKSGMTPMDAAKYLKDVVYSLGNLEGMTDSAQLAMSSNLGKSGRDTLLMDAFNISREEAHDINNRLDDRKPNNLRAVDMEDAFKIFPGLQRIIDQGIADGKRRDERRASLPAKAKPAPKAKVGDLASTSRGIIGKIARVHENGEVDIDAGDATYYNQTEFSFAQEPDYHSNLRARIAEKRKAATQLRKEAAAYNKETGGEAVRDKNKVITVPARMGGKGVDIIPFSRNRAGQHHQELLDSAVKLNREADHLETLLPQKPARAKPVTLSIKTIKTQAFPGGSINGMHVTNIPQNVLDALGYKGVWFKPGMPQTVYGQKDSAPDARTDDKLFEGDVTSELIPHLKERLSAGKAKTPKVVSVKAA